ncbi:MAG TPA: formate dehydrogenase subunit gamma [Nitrospirota bacterium]|nr:formate dehydrogenase subunit gamma [Nitrospirota bacterium]
MSSKMNNDPKKLLRYTPSERANHWLTAMCFILTALTGLSLYHPFFYPLSLWFGGGVWTRILHPFFGAAIVLFFGVMYARFRQHNVMNEADWEWVRRARELVNSDDRNMPEAGKFNGGQKLVFWLTAACILLLLLSGIVIWRVYFSFLFPIGLIRFAAVIHAISATLLIALIAFHIYAAVWTKESLSAMVYGRVRRAWAKQHHPLWFRRMTGEGK